MAEPGFWAALNSVGLGVAGTLIGSTAVVVGSVVWALARSHSTGEINTLRADNSRLKDERDGRAKEIEKLEKRIEKASPENIVDQIGEIRNILRNGIGNEWTNLSTEYFLKLAEEFRFIGSGYQTTICYQNYRGEQLAANLRDAAKAAGWKIQYHGMGGVSDVGIVVGPAGPNAERIASILRDATGKYVSVAPQSPFPVIADAKIITFAIGVDASEVD